MANFNKEEKLKKKQKIYTYVLIMDADDMLNGTIDKNNLNYKIDGYYIEINLGSCKYKRV